MIKKTITYSLICLFSICLLACSNADSSSSEAEAADLVVDINNPIHEIQPTMYGIFFEDINFAADGGLYAELVKNRSFEFDAPWMGWKHLPEAETRFNTVNELTIVRDANNPQNPRFVRVDKGDETPEFGLENEGFDGMGIKNGEKYDFSFVARQNKGNVTVKATLVDTTGNIIGSANTAVNGNDWKAYEVVITATATFGAAKLQVNFEGIGQIDIDQISLFPQDTWKGRKKGLRKDMVQLLAELNPGFIRFPGGCIVEGRTLDQRYQWKKTVGPVDERETLINRWNTEFAHRPAPDYFQSFGLGFFEYFQLSEDLGAEPLPILSCGLACQFNTSETVPMDQLDPYIDDALDLIEFANGSVNTKWGKIRASMGHPEPFNLKYIGVGNEQWGQEYFERYEAFAKAIYAKYPDMNIVSGTGPFSDGEMFEKAIKELERIKPELVDEHYYRTPDWFRENATRYDNYDRERFKIFAGEYAAQSVQTASPENRNTLECAISEAAFMTGLERNADVVYMTSYAPLFAHVNRWQWTPDLIWFDNLTAYGTANYYVQKMYGTNPGTHTLSIKREGENVTGRDGLYATAAIDKNSNELIIKVVNTLGSKREISLSLNGLSKAVEGTMTSLHGDDAGVFNTIEEPAKITPSESNVMAENGKLNLQMPANSFKVVRLKL
ncbi:alpha-L-arabinofuranosidase C-terminal domain-containing protein [Jiulongibacter sediminis]|jgi:alpha-N-arabinofuranosidase|uniref:alpha-L-arabinofuranosidase C-terminal domain-containing protein n=1 Tax=Jiulongibacter sediminis TaxID=1605367 RepID=UPI0026EFA990|nr:alpha-L-arabinofuranosidase C-terminal domain-containing protein [Jiulongibacter sediminis]